MYLKNLSDYNIILGSKSPRRQQLLAGIGLKFEVKVIETDEVFPLNLVRDEIPVYLAEMKAKAFFDIITDKDLLITADTIVLLDEKVIGKPEDKNDAIRILNTLSGRMHEVITGVCITTRSKTVSFFANSDVFFKKLSDEEIEYYLENYKPYDKAGAYGVQEWIGYIAVERIEGSFYNVMGLPVQRLYEHLKLF